VVKFFAFLEFKEKLTFFKGFNVKNHRKPFLKKVGVQKLINS